MRARSAFVSDQHEQIPMPMPISPESVGMLCCWSGHAAKPRFEEGRKLQQEIASGPRPTGKEVSWTYLKCLQQH